MAQQIDDILKELDAGYNPQRQAINDRITQLQPEADAQIQGLKQQQATAYRDINRSAADRGMFYSSIPSTDQADYVQKTFVPALANVQSTLNTTKSSLYDNLNNINLDQRKTAYGIRDSQLTREQAAADAAAARAASAGPDFSGLFNQPNQAANKPAAAYQQRADKGYNFQDHTGKAISAAQYSQLTGIPMTKLLRDMAAAGDNGAKIAMNYIGDDWKVNAPKLGNNQQAIAIVNSILGGVNKYTPAAAPKTAVKFNAPKTFADVGIGSRFGGLR